MNGWVVVGIGAADRGDDAVGELVADRVRELRPEGMTVLPVASPLELLEVFDAYGSVVIVDAVRAGGRPGAVTVSAIGEAPLPALPSAASTHGWGLAEVVELARAVDRLPARLVVVGVEVAEVATGADLSEPVARAVGPAADAVLRVAGSP